MAKNDVLDNYEELLIDTEEVRETLDIIYKWLSKKPNFNSVASYYDLIEKHSSHFALLNLAMYRLDALISEHRHIIENHIQGE